MEQQPNEEPKAVYKRRKKKDWVKKETPRIDMNPMCDLAFQLIIFFMLATTFMHPQTMEITMPGKPKDGDQEQSVKESKAVTLILSKNDELFWYQGVSNPVLNKTSYSKDGLRKVLSEKNDQIKDLTLLIKPDPASSYENLVDVLDEINIVDVKRYAVVDFTEEDLKIISAFNHGE